RFRDTLQKEAYPVVQVVGDTNPHQCIVVAGAIAFEEIRQIQRRLGQQTVADEIQRNEQTADSPVAIQKRVDGLELVMTDGGTDQVRYCNLFVVPKLLQFTHECRNALMMRRDEGGIDQAG